MLASAYLACPSEPCLWCSAKILTAPESVAVKTPAFGSGEILKTGLGTEGMISHMAARIILPSNSISKLMVSSQGISDLERVISHLEHRSVPDLVQ